MESKGRLNRILWGVSAIHGVGVFANQVFEAGDVIEECFYKNFENLADHPLLVGVGNAHLVLPEEANHVLGDDASVPVGYALLYNHADSYNAKATIQRRPSGPVLAIIASRVIYKGAEVTIDYRRTHPDGVSGLTS